MLISVLIFILASVEVVVVVLVGDNGLPWQWWWSMEVTMVMG